MASLRWYVKKAARSAVAAASQYSGSIHLRRALRAGPCVRVLTYHRFGHIARDPFCIEPEVFEAQIRMLAEEGRAISLSTLESFVSGEGSVPDDAVLVTIDDGFLSTYSEALPILRNLAVPAVAFLTAGLIERPGEGGLMPERYMTWEEAGTLGEASIEVASHAYAHASLGCMELEAVREQAERSREVLASRLGKEIRSFAYPFGTRADYSDMTREALGQAGYTSVFTSQHGIIRPGADGLELPRVKVEAGESLAHFRWLSRGAMDAWWLVDAALAGLQRDRIEQPLD